MPKFPLRQAMWPMGKDGYVYKVPQGRVYHAEKRKVTLEEMMQVSQKLEETVRMHQRAHDDLMRIVKENAEKRKKKD